MKAETPSLRERIDQLLERSGEYRFLAELLASPPDASTLEDAEALGLVDAGWRQRLEEIEVEFSRLFSVPGPEAVLPHQSVYTDVLRVEASAPDASGCFQTFSGGEYRGYVGGESCGEARRWYAAVGFRPWDPSPGMADHVSSQLAFVAHLYAAEASALESGAAADAAALRALRENFCRRFLDRWLGLFGRRVMVDRVSSLYRRVGRRLVEIAAQ